MVKLGEFLCVDMPVGHGRFGYSRSKDGRRSVDLYYSDTWVEPGIQQKEIDFGAETHEPILRIVIADSRSARSWEKVFQRLAGWMEEEKEATP